MANINRSLGMGIEKLAIKNMITKTMIRLFDDLLPAE